MLWAFVEELGRPYQGGGSFPGGKGEFETVFVPRELRVSHSKGSWEN